MKETPFSELTAEQQAEILADPEFVPHEQTLKRQDWKFQKMTLSKGTEKWVQCSHYFVGFPFTK